MNTEIIDAVNPLLPPADWAGEIERLQDLLLAERDQNLRALADYTNYRRRAENEGGKRDFENKRQIILSLLGILDDFEKALQFMNDVHEPFVDGIRIIYKKILALLESHGVVPFESAGEQFDHNRHAAIAMTKDAQCKPGTIVDVVQRGYLWKNDLLRAAQVRVAE